MQRLSFLLICFACTCTGKRVKVDPPAHAFQFAPRHTSQRRAIKNIPFRSASPVARESLEPESIEDRMQSFASKRSALKGALAALVALVAPELASAASRGGGRTGGRVGGRAPPRAAPTMSAAPRAAPAAPAVTQTNVYVNSAPTVVRSYGYGGGFGYSPGFVGGGFGIGDGAYVGLSLVESYFRAQRERRMIEQQLATQRELGKDQAQIQALEQRLSQQDAQLQQLNKQVKPEDIASYKAPPPQQGEDPQLAAMRKQLEDQAKELAAMKQQQRWIGRAHV